jgi:DNA-binding NtrC family response regulator
LKVLIVEDQAFIAADVADCVIEMGHQVVGIAPDCAAALEALSMRSPDVAIVDSQLGGETCEVVLEECDRGGIPVIISTGYMPADLPAYCGDRPYIGKPIDYDRLSLLFSTVQAPKANPGT